MKNKIFYKRGSLNLSVDKILSMVALRTSVFVSESNQVEPNKRVYVKYESVDSSILESMIFKVLRLAVGNVYNLQIFRFIAFFLLLFFLVFLFSSLSSVKLLHAFGLNAG